MSTFQEERFGPEPVPGWGGALVFPETLENKTNTQSLRRLFICLGYETLRESKNNCLAFASVCLNKIILHNFALLCSYLA